MVWHNFLTEEKGRDHDWNASSLTCCDGRNFPYDTQPAPVPAGRPRGDRVLHWVLSDWDLRNAPGVAAGLVVGILLRVRALELLGRVALVQGVGRGDFEPSGLEWLNGDRQLCPFRVFRSGFKGHFNNSRELHKPRKWQFIKGYRPAWIEFLMATSGGLEIRLRS